MTEIASRDLRNDTRGVLQRVEAGEEIHMTLSGRPVAVLQPLSGRCRCMPRAWLTELLDTHRTDSALTAELRELAPGTPTTCG